MHVRRFDPLPAGDGRAVERVARAELVFVEVRHGHGHVLFFTAGVGETEVDELDLVFLHELHDVGDGLCHQFLLSWMGGWEYRDAGCSFCAIVACVERVATGTLGAWNAVQFTKLVPSKSTHQFWAKLCIKSVQTFDELAVGRVEQFRVALDAELDMTAVLGVIDARQAENLDARMALLDRLHQGREGGLHGTENDHGLLHDPALDEKIGIKPVEHRLDHRPGHDRETGHEMDVTHAEAGDFVVGVGDDPGALGKHAHVEPVDVVGPVGLVGHALLARRVLHALADQQLGLGMQRQRHAQRLGGALAGVVVGGGADAAGREDD
ncbi:unnamed protein product, partial [Brugia timori]